MVETIAIRNPQVIKRVAAELKRGAGRNITEAAEELINEAVARRELERDRTSRPDERRQPATA